MMVLVTPLTRAWLAFFLVETFEALSERESIDEAIAKLNSESPTAVFGRNKFGDMTQEEFASKVLMSVPFNYEDFHAKPQYISENANIMDLPDSFDWRDHGAVTPVKDQGSVGSCYAFSTDGNIEGQWQISKGELTSLSAEWIVDCDYLDCGMMGGWPFQVMEFVIEQGGIPSVKDKPYCSGLGNGTCFPCAPNANETQCGPPPWYCNQTWTDMQCCDDCWTVSAKISDWMPISSDETEMAAALVNIGPLSIAMDASGLQWYKNGVFNPNRCNPDKLNHAILIVGYGVDTDSGLQYWTVKNSWGSDWGEDGYFRIVRGVGMCGLNTAVVTACVDECTSVL